MLNQKQLNALNRMNECANIIISRMKHRDCDETRYSKDLAERIIEGINYIKEHDESMKPWF